MQRILWRAKSPILGDCLRRGGLVPRARGGDAYNFHAATILRRRYGLSLDESSSRRPGEGWLRYTWRARRAVAGADVVIQDPFFTSFGRKRRESTHVCVMHHFDCDLERSSLVARAFFGRLRRGLQRVDAVVTVSRFWKDELEAMGCRDVRVIYNAFDLGEYEVDPAEIEDLRRRHDLDADRPLVYIGNARRAKGVAEVAHALAGEPYALVMSGRADPGLEHLPCRHLDVDRRDYVRLLAASDVVVTMSRMTEGWNRTAHEAMLVNTPVIGSGSGGMRELLERGGQRIVSNPADLPEALGAVLSRRDELGRRGRTFVEQFDAAYFDRAWTDLVAELR